MDRLLVSVVALLFFGYLSAQERPIETVYFEFDKFNLPNNQIEIIVNFIKRIETAKVEAIQI